ncbi:MAG TPA: ATP-binding protein, partial [Verrucomicrobiae bacterium]|nr:ATP-binding protein [Verrucomicrobiae bacterium]
LLVQLVSQSKAHYLVQAERDRIARDIHDDLGSKLTQLLLAGEVAQIGSGTATAAPLSEICDGARDILATIDEVVWIVNSQHDNLEDFAIYVCKYVQHFLQPTAIRCRFDVPTEMPAKTLSQLIRRNLFLAIKEAVSNAAKHSQATQLTLRIELDNCRLNVFVTDNGHGFDSSQVSHERNGLVNMKLRLAEIGGVCLVAGRLGEGCQIHFQVPLQPPPFLKPWFQTAKLRQSPAVLPGQPPGKSSSANDGQTPPAAPREKNPLPSQGSV